MKILLVVLALAYALSPIDLFPDMFIGWGWLDDLVILGLLFRYLFFSGKSRPRYDGRQQYRNRRPDGEKADENAHRGEAGGQEAFAKDDPYRILGVAPGAGPEEIKSAYRRLAGKYHPDKVAHLGDEFRRLAEERFKEIQEAYSKISSGK